MHIGIEVCLFWKPKNKIYCWTLDPLYCICFNFKLFSEFWLFLLFLFKDFAKKKKKSKDVHGEIYMEQVADNSLSLRPPVFSVRCDLCRVCCVSASSRCILTCCAVFISENSVLPEVTLLQSSPRKSFQLLYFAPRLMPDQFDKTFQN